MLPGFSSPLSSQVDPRWFAQLRVDPCGLLTLSSERHCRRCAVQVGAYLGRARNMSKLSGTEEARQPKSARRGRILV